MKTIEEKLAVMRGWLEGKNLQYKLLNGACWIDLANPLWDWEQYDYRIKPEPTPKRRVPLGPEDLPAVCWVRGPINGTGLLVVGVRLEHIRIVCINRTEEMHFAHLMNWEYSEDRKNWKPMWKEVE